MNNIKYDIADEILLRFKICHIDKNHDGTITYEVQPMADSFGCLYTNSKTYSIKQPDIPEKDVPIGEVLNRIINEEGL